MHSGAMPQALVPDFTPAAHDNSYLRDFVSQLDRRNLFDLTVDDRCKIVQHLRNEIYTTAKKGKHTEIKNNVEYIDASVFEDEVATLHNVLDTLDYSPDLYDWLHDRRQDFVRILNKQYPLQSLKKEWDGAGQLEDRAVLLEKMVWLQSKTYQVDAIAFLPSRVVIDTKAHATLQGYTIIDASVLTPSQPPDIHVKERLLKEDDPAMPLKTAFHEQLHALFAQLATAAHLGMMPKTHKLHDDAQLQRSKILYSARVPSTLFESYTYQPEERAVRTQHELFLNEFAAPLPTVKDVIKDIFRLKF
jgi:hypothetical protein